MAARNPILGVPSVQLADDVGSATHLVAITPNDATDLTDEGIRLLWIGTGGTVVVQGIDDAAPVTIANVPDGTSMAIRVSRVMTATSASQIVGMG